MLLFTIINLKLIIIIIIIVYYYVIIAIIMFIIYIGYVVITSLLPLCTYLVNGGPFSQHRSERSEVANGGFVQMEVWITKIRTNLNSNKTNRGTECL